MKDINPRDNDGSTPLHMAAEKGYSKVCKLIIEDLEDINPGDNHGFTPLHLAAKNGNLNVCEIILKRLQDKNPPTPNGVTPLHMAAAVGHFNVCKLICKNVSKVDVVGFINNVGWTPIKLALFRKNWSVVWLLVCFQSALQ